MRYLSVFVLLAALAGCAVHAPGGSVVIDPHPSGDGFCPPGQAKKGRC